MNSYDDPGAIDRLGRTPAPLWTKEEALNHRLSKGRYAGLTIGQIAQTEEVRDFLLWMRSQE